MSPYTQRRSSWTPLSISSDVTSLSSTHFRFVCSKRAGYKLSLMNSRRQNENKINFSAFYTSAMVNAYFSLWRVQLWWLGDTIIEQTFRRTGYDIFVCSWCFRRRRRVEKKKKKTGFEFGLSRGECINVYQRLSFNRGVTQLNTRNRAACDNVSMFNNIAPSEEVLHSWARATRMNPCTVTFRPESLQTHGCLSVFWRPCYSGKTPPVFPNLASEALFFIPRKQPDEQRVSKKCRQKKPNLKQRVEK